MAQPTGHQNIMLSAAQGMPSSGAPSLIPNGQPPQWNRPPPMSHAVKSRPPPAGSNITPSVSNGTPTPPGHSHPGSLSSHSSRDPSPIPPNRHGENFSSSSPNLIMASSQSLHSQSSTPTSLQRGSPGINVNASQQRIPQYNAQVMSPSLVNQSTGQTRSVGVLASTPSPQAGSPLPPVATVSPSLPLDEVSSRNVTPQNIPSTFVNQTNQQQRLGTSQLPPQSLGHGNKEHNVDNRSALPHQDLPPHSVTNSLSNGPPASARPVGGFQQQNVQAQAAPVPISSAQGFVLNRPQGAPSMSRPQMGTNSPYTSGMPMQRPQMPQTSLPPRGVPPLQPGGIQKPPNSGMPPNSLGFAYSGMPPASGSPAQPGVPSEMPPTSTGPIVGGAPHSIAPPVSPASVSHPHPGVASSSSGQAPSGAPISQSYMQPAQFGGVPTSSAVYSPAGMPPLNTGYSQQAKIPPTSGGYSQPQPGMPPTSGGYSQSGMAPSSSGYSQLGMAPSSAGYSQQPKIPPTSSGYSQPGMPPSSSGYSQPGMPPSSSGYSQPGMPPSSSGYSQPGMPPSSSGYSQPGIPTSSGGYSQPGMPPSGSGYSQPGMPPTSAGYSHQGMSPTSAGHSQSGVPPSSGYSQSGVPPTSARYSQPGMPPTSGGHSQPGAPPSSGYSQQGMPSTSAAYSQPGMPPLSAGHSQPGMPNSGYSQPGMTPTSAGYSQQSMPPASGRYPQPGMPPASGGLSQPGIPSTPNQFQGPPQGGMSQQDSSHHFGKRYPQQQPYQPQRGQPGGDALAPQMAGLSVAQMGFNKLWGMEGIDLLQNRNVLPAGKVDSPKVRLHQEFLDSVNCSTEIFRCTLTKIPETNSLLSKSRLPLGILIHPFKDLNHLPVIQCSTIVRCRSCRTYINPFVYFVDHKRWKCNLCFRVNELPEEFQYDPVSKTYGDPTRRPEVKSSTIEFIAPSEYMLRPPQPAVYLFLLDVSRLAVDCGYLRLFCDILLEELDKLPGDGRTHIGFITFDSCVHFYNLAEGLSQPQQMIVVDTDDVFLPCPDNLLVNLSESRELVKDLLNQIPTKFLNSHDTKCALGPALQAAYKLMAPTGGRVTVFQTCLPNHGPGMLSVREDPSQRAGKEAPHLNPATDFYKRLALDCSGQQIAVDLFLINSQYSDLATLSGISRFSGGCIFHFPLFKASNVVMADSLERSFRRYLTRKIGFEAVMRIRCSRGLAIHTFHGNFFVRSTDLLSLPNVNPDAGFGMQVSIEESLSDVQNVCFQAALLYTSSKGERRIRVHTLCLPVAANLSDILYSADQQCIVGLLAKMAVDRSHQSSLSDARDAFINVAIDVLSAYKLVQSSANSSSLLAPSNLRLLPLYILALLKYIAFRTGQSTRLDDRLFAMCQMKTLPLAHLIQAIYPDMYPVHYLDDKSIEEIEVDGVLIAQPPRLHLSAEKLDSHGAFLMDAGDHMMLYVGHNISSAFCSAVLGVPAFSHIPEDMFELPENESPESERLRNFLNHIQSEKPYPTMLQVIRDDSPHRAKFIERLIEDRSESALSYYEFLQHLKSNVK